MIATECQSLFTEEGIGELNIGDGPLERPHELASVLRTKIKNFKVARKPRKIPQRILVQVLKCVIHKTKFKKSFYKYGVKVPESYRVAISGSDGAEWKLEMDQETSTLSDLGAFLKGLSAKDLPPGYDISDVIRSIWVYDVKVDGRKRARFAARGDMEAEDPESDNFSPVAQMRTVRVLLAVAAQLNLELVTMDFPKAFLLGKMDKSKPIFMHAPEGYGSPGEIWGICLPLYGLTVSSRRFYESLSEFMRAVGFSHFGGGDPCLFRRKRQLPNELQAKVNHTSAQEAGLPGRPLKNGKVLPQALPKAPQPSGWAPLFKWKSSIQTTWTPLLTKTNPMFPSKCTMQLV